MAPKVKKKQGIKKMELGWTIRADRPVRKEKGEVKRNLGSSQTVFRGVVNSSSWRKYRVERRQETQHPGNSFCLKKKSS